MLQLRLHPALLALKQAIESAPSGGHEVTLTYVTPRGRWYDVSWKGSEERSGGLLRVRILGADGKSRNVTAEEPAYTMSLGRTPSPARTSSATSTPR